ncbi:hypothetical protein [Cellulomonas sp. Marseille-Q8402]
MDPAPVQRALVAWRLLAVSTTVLATGSGAHVLAGGHAPGPGVVALLGALVLLVAAALARRPLTVPVLLPVAVAAQVGVHVALTWLAGADATSAAVAHGTHGLHGAVVLPAGTSAPVLDAHAGTAGLLMPAAHAAAAAATVLLIVATERAVLGLVRRWSALLPALGDGLPGPVAPRPRPAAPPSARGRACGRWPAASPAADRRPCPAPARPPDPPHAGGWPGRAVTPLSRTPEVNPCPQPPVPSSAPPRAPASPPPWCSAPPPPRPPTCTSTPRPRRPAPTPC